MNVLNAAAIAGLSLRGLQRRLGLSSRAAGGFEGSYRSLDDAKRVASASGNGYDQQQILEKVAAATNAVISGEALFERDTVLFKHADYPYPVLACLLNIAARSGGHLSVLDFGGALGSLYYQCRPFFRGLGSVKWSIVEQPHFVALGREKFQNDAVRFFSSVDECITSEAPNLAMFSGVLQYLEEPKIPLNAVCRAGLDVLIDRTPTVDTEEDFYSVQIVPASIYEARLPFRAFGRSSLRRLMSADYVRVVEFDAVDPVTRAGAVSMRFEGVLFRKSEHL